MSQEEFNPKDYLKKAENIFSEIGAKQDLKNVSEALGKAPQKEELEEVEEELLDSPLRKKREILFVLETCNAISSILDIEKLLEKIIDSAMEISGAERGFLMLYDEARKNLEVRVARNIDKQEMKDKKLAISKNIIKEVEVTRKPVFTTDARSDKRFEQKESVIEHNLRSIMCIPLIHRTRLMGLLYVDNRLVTHLFDEHDLELMTPLVTQAAISIENARAYRKIEELGVMMARSEKLAALGKLAGVISHELRNPLSAIKSAAYYISMKVGDVKDSKVKKHLSIIAKEVDNSTRIIEDILAYARIRMPEFEKTESGPVVQEALNLVPAPPNIKTDFKADKNLPFVLADRSQLRQVFSNLISNAYEAMPNGGALSISARIINDAIEIKFKDSGAGIPAENFKKIFDMLFTTKVKGTGFGLAICHTIIDGHNGTIGVESEVGRGTTFTVSLPV
ncbi:ATP-binding protein [Candidatus Margulisiibacteriota bacterium]